VVTRVATARWSPMNATRRPEAGFTMIEVMVALLLTAIAVMGLLGVYLGQTRASSYSRHTSEAVILAQDKFEQLARRPRVTTSVPRRTSTSAASGPACSRGTGRLRSGAGYADVVVTITWSEDGVARQFVLRGRRNT